MSNIPQLGTIINKLRGHGLSDSAILDIVETLAHTTPRSGNAERQARYRARKAATVTSNVTDNAERNATAVPPDGSPKNNNQTLPSPPPVPSLRSGTARTEFHEIFWPEYPHKTGKPVAEKSFIRARKSHDLDAIMAGLRTYVRIKPADRDWLNPATFLNQERFLDAPAATVHRPTFGQPQGQPPPAYVSPYAAPKGLTLEEARIEAAKIHARGQAR